MREKYFRTWPPELTARIIELYNQGTNPAEIRKYFKLNYNIEFSDTSVKTKLWRLRKAGKIRGYINPQMKRVKETLTNLPKEEAEILSFLKEGPLSIGELSRRLDRSKETIVKLMDNLREKGYDVNIDEAEKRARLEREIGKSFKPLELSLYRNRVRIGVVSDSHLGSKYQQLTLLHTIYKEFEKEKIDFALHCGDVVEGKNLYRGQDTECFLHGADEMKDYVIDHYPKSDKFKTYVIGGCLTPDHLVFIKGRGFLEWSKVKEGDYALSICQKNRPYKHNQDVDKLATKWSKVKKIISYSLSEEMYHLKTNQMDCFCTSDHRVLLAPQRYKTLRYEYAKDVFKRRGYDIPKAAKINISDCELSDNEIKLLAWFVSEGTWLSGNRGVQLYQLKGEKFQSIIELLKDLKYKYSIYKDNRNENFRVIYISKKDIQILKDNLFNQNKLNLQKFMYKLSARQAQVFLQTYILGDGHQKHKNASEIYTKSKILAEQLAYLAVISGWRTQVKERIRECNAPNAKNRDLRSCWTISICYREMASICGDKIKKIPYKGVVFDLTIEAGNFLVMRNGKIYFTGNSHDLSFKKIAGFNIVRAICGRRADLIYRGEESTNFKMRELNIEMLHPGGGVSYALSYRPQRIAENMLGDIISIIRTKKDTSILPNCLFLGHYHIVNHLPQYMGMEVFSVPCLQSQTPYLKRKGLAPVLGYLIVDIYLNKVNNVVRTVPDFRFLNDVAKDNDY